MNSIKEEQSLFDNYCSYFCIEEKAESAPREKILVNVDILSSYIEHSTRSLFVSGKIITALEISEMYFSDEKGLINTASLRKEDQTTYGFTFITTILNESDTFLSVCELKTEQGRYYHTLKIILNDIKRSNESLAVFDTISDIVDVSSKSEVIVNDLAYTIPKVALKKLKQEYSQNAVIDFDLLELHNIPLAEVISSNAEVTPENINYIFKKIRSARSVKKGKSRHPKVRNHLIEKSRENQKIAFVTTECEYITPKSPWGVYVYEMAKRYAEYSIVSIYVIPSKEMHSQIYDNVAYYREYFTKNNITLQVPDLEKEFDLFYVKEDQKRSYYVYNLLKKINVDHVLIEGTLGIAYYTLLSKALGDEFEYTNIHVFFNDLRAEKVTQISSELFLDDILETVYMEKATLQMAPYVYTLNKKVFSALQYYSNIFTEVRHLKPIISNAHRFENIEITDDESYTLLVSSQNGMNCNFHSILINPETSVDELLRIIKSHQGKIVLDISLPHFDYIVTLLKGRRDISYVSISKSGDLEKCIIKENVSRELNIFTEYDSDCASCEDLSKVLGNDQRILVSICIPTRNRIHYLRCALESLRASTYKNIEIIIVDDGSDDLHYKVALRDIAETYNDYPLFVIEQDRNYPGFARNVALAFSRGKYVFFLDDDNEVFPSTIETLVQTAERCDLDFLSCSLEYKKDDLDKKTIKPFLGADLDNGIFKNNFGDTFSLAKRRSVLQLGGFDTTRNASHEDWELFTRAVLRGFTFSTHPCPLGLYTSNQASYNHTSSKFHSKKQVLQPYLLFAQSEDRKDIPCLRKLVDILSLTDVLVHSTRDSCKEKFEEALDSLLLLYHEEVSRYLTAGGDTKIISLAHGAAISSKCSDPHVLIPPCNTDGYSHIYVRILLTTECNDYAQLFYLSKNSMHYDEKQKYTAPIQKGLNEIYFELSNISELILPLRLDPGFSSHTYTIQSIELRGVKDDRE